MYSLNLSIPNKFWILMSIKLYHRTVLMTLTFWMAHDIDFKCCFCGKNAVLLTWLQRGHNNPSQQSFYQMIAVIQRKEWKFHIAHFSIWTYWSWFIPCIHNIKFMFVIYLLTNPSIKNQSMVNLPQTFIIKSSLMWVGWLTLYTNNKFSKVRVRLTHHGICSL